MSGLFAEISPVRLMALPFLECLVLVGIHSYLGLHVIRRQVIFVDLSLAQIAALGTTVGFLLGIHPHGFGAFLFSLSFTFLGAAVFAMTRSRRERVPQEAIIGLVYALAAALMILVIDRAPHGAEHIKEVLTGSILWVKGSEVLEAAVAYAFVGIFHYVFRHKFMAITDDAEAARDQGINVALWDLLFYMSFGFVITYSVNVAGVLLVFVFLVVPAVIGASITDNFKYQLLIGWGMGTVVSIVGLALSYWLDVPSGPAVVSFYGLVLLMVALTLYVIRSKNRKRAMGRLGLGAVGLVLVVGYFAGLKRVIWAVPSWREGEFSHSRARAPHKRKRTKVQRFDDQDIEAKAMAVKKMKDLARISAFFAKSETPAGKLELAQRAAQIDHPTGARLLLQVFDSQAPVFFREKALQGVRKICKKKFELDLMKDDLTKEEEERVTREVRRCVQDRFPAPMTPPAMAPRTPNP